MSANIAMGAAVLAAFFGFLAFGGRPATYRARCEANTWVIATRNEDVSPAEMQRRLNEQAGAQYFA